MRLYALKRGGDDKDVIFLAALPHKKHTMSILQTYEALWLVNKVDIWEEGPLKKSSAALAPREARGIQLYFISLLPKNGDNPTPVLSPGMMQV